MQKNPDDLQFFTQKLWLEMWEQLAELTKTTNYILAPSHYYYQVLSEYNLSRRHYHDARHIDNCVRLWLEVKDQFLYPYVALYALIMHDYIYDPVAKDNESKSGLAAAKLWAAVGLSANGVWINVVQRHIEATNHQGDPTYPDTQLVVDIDLASLTAPWPEFEKNTEDIRREYSEIPDEVFWPKRKEILESFLAPTRKGIYRTKYFQERFGIAAQQNLIQALYHIDKRLSDLSPP